MYNRYYDEIVTFMYEFVPENTMISSLVQD